MLGKKLGEDKGKITGQRVLDATGPKIEVSFSTVGTYAGIDCKYWNLLDYSYRQQTRCMGRQRAC